MRQLAFAHHDPLRTDDALDQIVQAVRADLAERKSPLHAFAAADGQIVEVRAHDHPQQTPESIASTTPAAAPAIRESTVVMGISDTQLAAALAEATRTEGVRMSQASDGDSLLQMVKSESPSLVLMEDRLSGLDALAICRSVRATGGEDLKKVPIVIVADRERADEGKAAGVTGWLVTPFTTQYARAYIQSWIMRTACRWARAAIRPDEDTRLATLRALGLLDTPPEERFDRITRVAAALAGVPVAYVSLVDANRQWFKSCLGFALSEISRDAAFCAHVVLKREFLVIPDTLRDDRFADNPHVTGEPGIRFYAGFPVFHKNGSCLGTLCLADTRPRQFSEAMIKMFADLASIVQQEVNAGNGK